MRSQAVVCGIVVLFLVPGFLTADLAAVHFPSGPVAHRRTHPSPGDLFEMQALMLTPDNFLLQAYSRHRAATSMQKVGRLGHQPADFQRMAVGLRAYILSHLPNGTTLFAVPQEIQALVGNQSILPIVMREGKTLREARTELLRDYPGLAARMPFIEFRLKGQQTALSPLDYVIQPGDRIGLHIGNQGLLEGLLFGRFLHNLDAILTAFGMLDRRSLALANEALGLTDLMRRAPVISAKVELLMQLDQILTRIEQTWGARGGISPPAVDRSLTAAEGISRAVSAARDMVHTGLIPEATTDLDLNLRVQSQVEWIKCEFASWSKNIIFEEKFGLALGPVHGRASEISQVAVNLIQNAREALIRANTPNPRIVISTFRDSARNQNAFQLADNGPGFDASQSELPSTTKEVDPGLHGKGLISVQQIVEAHGGSLQIQSKPGAGAIITAYFPIAPTAAALAASAAATSQRLRPGIKSRPNHFWPILELPRNLQQRHPVFTKSLRTAS